MKPTLYNDNYEGIPNPEDQLHEAIGKEDIAEVQQLINGNNVKRLHSRTNKPPIIYAAVYGNCEAFKLLQDNGATIVDAITDDGFTALDYCPRHNFIDSKRDVKPSLHFIYEHTLKEINSYRNKLNPTPSDNTNAVLLSLSVIRYLYSKENKSQADLDDIETYLQFVLNAVNQELNKDSEPVVLLQLACVLNVLGKSEQANHFFNLTLQRYKSLELLDKGINIMINCAITLKYAFSSREYYWASFNCYLFVIQSHLEMKKNEEARQITEDCLFSLEAFLSRDQKSNVYRIIGQCFMQYQVGHLIAGHANKVAIAFAETNQCEYAATWFELGYYHDKEKINQPEIYLANLIKVAIKTRSLMDAKKWAIIIINLYEEKNSLASELTNIDKDWTDAIGPTHNDNYFDFPLDMRILLFDLAKYAEKLLDKVKYEYKDVKRDWQVLIFDLFKASHSYSHASVVAKKLMSHYLGSEHEAYRISLENKSQAANWCQAAAECNKLDYLHSKLSANSFEQCGELSFKAGKLFQEMNDDYKAFQCYQIALEGLSRNCLNANHKMLIARCAIEQGHIHIKQRRIKEAGKSLQLATESIFPIVIDDKSLFTNKENSLVNIAIYPVEHPSFFDSFFNTKPLFTMVFCIEYFELTYKLATTLEMTRTRSWAAFHCTILNSHYQTSNKPSVDTYWKIAIEYFQKQQQAEMVAGITIIYVKSLLNILKRTNMQLNNQQSLELMPYVIAAADLYFLRDNKNLIENAVSIVTDLCESLADHPDSAIAIKYSELGCKYLQKLGHYYLSLEYKDKYISTINQMAMYLLDIDRPREALYYFHQEFLLYGTTITQSIYQKLLRNMISCYGENDGSLDIKVYECLNCLLSRGNNFDQNFIIYVDYIFNNDAARSKDTLLMIYQGLLFFKEKVYENQESYISFIRANNIDLLEIDALIAKLKSYIFPEKPFKSLKDRVLDVVKKRNGGISLDDYVVKNVKQELDINNLQSELNRRNTLIFRKNALIEQKQQQIAELERKIKALEHGEKTSVAANKKLLIWQSGKSTELRDGNSPKHDTLEKREMDLLRHRRRKSR